MSQKITLKGEQIMPSLVSIIMPSYNTGRYIENSIKSVLAQTYKEWELLIVDDCSKDDTDRIIAPYLEDKRIHYLKNEKNMGAALSRNRAIRVAKGKYIAFLDSDDIWEAHKLEKQIQFMRKNNYAFSFTDFTIRVNGKLLPYVYTGPNVVGKIKMINYCYIFTSTVMYNREKVGEIQIEDLKKNNDYAMWLLIVKKFPCYRLAESLACYNKHENSISSGSKLKLIKYHYILFNKGMKKNKLISVLLTLNNLFWGVIQKFTHRRNLTESEQREFK